MHVETTILSLHSTLGLFRDNNRRSSRARHSLSFSLLFSKKRCFCTKLDPAQAARLSIPKKARCR
eukprot:scaffold40411_cov145-Amphora_coffeaeformis.AAC.1